MDDLFMTVCFKEIVRCSNMVLRVLHGNFKGFSRVFQGLFKESSRAFQESFAGCSKGCQGCSSLFLGSVSKVFRGSFKKMFNVFLKSFILIAATRAEGGLVHF